MPIVNFTARGIAGIKPPAKGRIEYWDSGIPGFGMRVSATGVKTWITMYRHNGRKRRHTLGVYPAMTLADANEKARHSLNMAANGNDPAAEKTSARLADTFGELADEYMTWHAKQKKKRWEFDQRMLNSDLLPKWKNIKAKDIARRDVIRVLDEIMARGAPIQANRVLTLVRKVFNFAIARDIVQFNPCQAVPLPAKPKTRDRVLSAEEIRKVWASAEQDDPLIAAMLKLRLLTAQRGGEIEAMSWDDIDFEAAIWTIPGDLAKNGLAHRVPLSFQSLELLRQLNSTRASSRWVFPSPLGPDKHIENIQKAIQRVRAREECQVDFVGHDLRRTAASNMASMGIPRLVISKVLNHVEQGVTAVYDRHSYDREKREALEAWSKRLEAILAKEDATNVTSLRRSGVVFSVASEKHA